MLRDKALNGVACDTLRITLWASPLVAVAGKYSLAGFIHAERCAGVGCGFILPRPNMAARLAFTAANDAVCLHRIISLRALLSWGFKGTVRAGTGPCGG